MKLKTLIITFLITVLSITAYAQVNTANKKINWVYDMQAAQVMALNQNKLIITSFWAVWCKPCIQMNDLLWDDPKLKAIANNFIFLKIDIERNIELIKELEVYSVPNISIMDASKEIIFSKIGFNCRDKNDANGVINIIKKLPYSLPKTHTLALESKLKNKLGSVGYYHLGKSYQNIAMETKSKTLKRNALKISDTHFNTLLSKSKNEASILKAELNIVLNKIYNGRKKKALKRYHELEINTLDEDVKNTVAIIKDYI